MERTFKSSVITKEKIQELLEQGFTPERVAANYGISVQDLGAALIALYGVEAKMIARRFELNRKK